jgi:RNA polymerase sigma-70 factor (ECF subfamily)
MTTYPDPADPLDPDRDLMKKVAAGDHIAFRDLVERHQKLVVGMVVRMIGAADAEDISQQVFLNVWKSAPRWRPEAKALTWILTIAKRLVFNETRRRSRSRIVRQTESDEKTLEFPDQAPSPDQSLRDAELHAAVEKAMAALGEKERMAVILRRHEGMPYDEIATILGMSVPAVKSLLFRARTSLRQQLSAYLES